MKEERLINFFKKHGAVAVAFSGGVDSSYLLYAAKKADISVEAFFVKSPFQPLFEREDVINMASQLGVKLNVIEANPLDNPTVSANPKDRCYHCKKLIFTQILSAAKAKGFTTIIDGINFSDDYDDRPGMRALEEMLVLSPLRSCEISKKEVRELSKNAGLFTHDKPAYACLATRVPTGRLITQDILTTVEQSEDFLRGLGFKNYRVRLIDDGCKLELTKADTQYLFDHQQNIYEKLKEFYSFVTLDLKYRVED